MTWLCQYWIHYHSNSLREYYEDRLRDCTYKSLLDSYKDSAPRLASIFAICYYCATSLLWLFRKNTLINKQMNNQTFGGRWFLWTTGLFSHQEYFHNYVTMIFNIHTHKVTLGIEVNSYLPWCNFKALSKCLWRCDVAYCTVYLKHSNLTRHAKLLEFLERLFINSSSTVSGFSNCVPIFPLHYLLNPNNTRGSVVTGRLSSCLGPAGHRCTLYC